MGLEEREEPTWTSSYKPQPGSGGWVPDALADSTPRSPATCHHRWPATIHLSTMSLSHHLETFSAVFAVRATRPSPRCAKPSSRPETIDGPLPGSCFPPCASSARAMETDYNFAGLSTHAINCQYQPLGRRSRHTEIHLLRARKMRLTIAVNVVGPPPFLLIRLLKANDPSRDCAKRQVSCLVDSHGTQCPFCRPALLVPLSPSVRGWDRPGRRFLTGQMWTRLLDDAVDHRAPHSGGREEQEGSRDFPSLLRADPRSVLEAAERGCRGRPPPLAPLWRNSSGAIQPSSASEVPQAEHQQPAASAVGVRTPLP